jgi:hypothetical protein
VLAAWVKEVHDHQIGIGEQPLLSAGTRRFGRSSRSQVLIACHSAQMLDANAGQTGDFVLGKKLLTRPDSDHFGGLSICRMLLED